jgi:hypothetical protein
MASDRTEPRHADHIRSKDDESYDLEYWTKDLGMSAERFREIVLDG